MKMKKYYPILKYRADERCSWIGYCSANDNAFTTLAKKVGMDVGYF